MPPHHPRQLAQFDRLSANYSCAPSSANTLGSASMRRMVVLLIASCSVTSDAEVTRPEPLGPLPLPASVETDRFRDAETCGQCHLVKDDTTVLHDMSGANVSPVLLWRSSLMANAALKEPPKVPKSVIVPSCQRKAW